MNDDDKGPTERLTAENLTKHVYEAFEQIAQGQGLTPEQLFEIVVKETFWRFKKAAAIKTIEGGKEGPKRPGSPKRKPGKPQP